MAKNRLYRFLIILFTGIQSLLIPAANAISTVNPPLLKCVSVNSNGSINLSWSNQSVSPENFNAYFIYFAANQSGPYTIADSLFNYNQLSYDHLTVNANSSNIYYFIRTRGIGGNSDLSVPSDTLKSIRLDVSGSNGNAVLNWNPIHIPPVTGTSSFYQIYREFPANIWSLIDSTDKTRFIDSISICSVIYNYRILLGNSSGCSSVSSVAGSSTLSGSAFEDNNVPYIPFIDSVSVDTSTSKARLSWFVNGARDTKGYIIYRKSNIGWNIIDTVVGRNNTFYNYLFSEAGIKSESFAVAAYDSCNNISPIGIEQNSIYLKVALNVCKVTNELRWNQYKNWLEGVKHYEIWASKNNEPFKLLGTSASNDTSFDHTGLTYASTYCYFIRAIAVSDERSSTSNKTCIFINTTRPPSYTYLAAVTVIAPDQVDLVFYTDFMGKPTSYNILRSTAETGMFEKLGTIANASKSKYEFSDKAVNTNLNSYYYKIQAVDNCENILIVSNTSRTILLSGTASLDLTNSLTWNLYESWSGGVESYKLYRSVGGTFATDPILILDSTGTAYTDDVFLLKDHSGNFCYYIEAFEGDDYAFDKKQSSKSNVKCLVQFPKVFIPNAFSPNGDGLNDTFFPVSVFVEVSQYLFIIYDSFGQKIFETKDKAIAWDGKVKGRIVPTGIYGYYLEVTLPSGESFEKGGTITVVK